MDFANGSLVLTEAGSTRRASLHMVHGAAGIAALDPGGLEPLAADLPAFAARLASERHTLKRALTDPSLFSGIGNAYSDEILHRAGLSPMRMTDALSGEELARLFAATQATLEEWRDALIAETGDGFPERVTAFRPGMRVHGRYGQPCPVCGTAVQRIRYASNEANYCPACQTGGRLLADRGAVAAPEGRLAALARRTRTPQARTALTTATTARHAASAATAASRQAFGSCSVRCSRLTSKPERLATPSAWAIADSSMVMVRA